MKKIILMTAIIMVVWPEPAALAGEKQPPKQTPAAQQEANETRQFPKTSENWLEKRSNYPTRIIIKKLFPPSKTH